MNRSSNLLAALVLVTGGTVFAQTPTRAVPKEFGHVRTLGHALAEFVDDRVQVVAAYYYSQSTHDIPWLLIELGALWPRTMEINREQIELVTPSGGVVRLATQARWAADSTRNALLMQQATTSRHQVAHYFKPDNQTYLRFFTRPPDDGTVQQAVYLRPYELGLSDLLFESPTRLWDKGTYALVLRYDGGEAVLPIELR